MNLPIDDPNQSLLHFLDRYCLSGISPGYAVMLKGPWGSGKTWFIEMYQEKLRAGGQKPLYVTLFGVSKPSDISDQLFAQIHPRLGSAKVQKTWALTKSLLKGTIKLDLDGDGKDDGTLQIAIPELEKWASTKGTILIFDDLERCGMPIVDFLGLINQFVEHDGYRVLVLANEEAKSIEHASGFVSIKEKVIGRTFQIKPNTPAALDHFLEEVSLRDAHAILNRERDEILAVFQRAEYDNLRQLRQAVLDFSDIWDCIYTQGLDEKTEFVRRLLNDVLTLSIEHRAGTLTVADIADLGMRDWSKFLMDKEDDSDEKTLSPKEQALKRHRFDQEPALALAASAYAEFFGQGNLSKSLAKECLESSHYLANKSTASWRRLWYLLSLTDEKFKEFSDDVLERLTSLEYVSNGELLHTVSILLSLASRGLIAQTKADMLAIAKSVVEELAVAGKLDLGSNGDRSGASDWDLSAFGLGFTDRETKEFREFFDYYRQQQSSARMKMLRQQASAWMPMLEADPEVWSKQLVRHGIEESLFAEDPVFAFVSAEHAAEMLHRVPAPTLEIVRRSLKERYAHPNESTKWKLDELPFLQKVYEHLTARVKSNGGPMSLSKYALETWFLPGLEMITNDLLTFQSQLAPKSQAGQ
ncbi:P-loop NTPase fold protein [Candidatus Accumulibacter phosphatis]|uniref:P-loop NTPase fold protein n=1 Tax=Candidatus Accumulibacter phosphatis TaxID=327160 RepID=UPI0039B90B5B